MGLFIDPDGLDWIPLLFLLVVYGYILYVSSNMISDGSELLLLIKSVAGIVGSVVLPVLGAVPDGAIVLFSGLGPGAQQQLSVGVGALAGSTIMLLTLPWLLSVVAGRVDVGAKGDPVYHKLPRLTTKQRFSLSTGVLAGSSVATSANIMLLTAVSFVIIQVPAFVEGCGKGATEAECLKHKDVTKWFALVGLVVCVTLFVWYLYKQVRAWRRSTPCSHALHRPPTQTSPQPRLCLPRALGPQVVGNNVVGDAKREQRIERAIINQEISAHAVFAHMIQQSIRSSSKLLGARHDEKEMRHVLNHMFDRYDSAPRDQQLDKAELRQLVNALHGGTPFSDEDYDAWFESLDRDGDGQVSRPEFVSAMKEYFKTGSKRRGALTPVGAAQVRQRLQGAGAPGVSGANGEAKAGADVEMANAAQKSGNGGLHVGTGSAGDTGGESEDEDDSSEEEEEEEMPEDLVGLPHHVQMRKVKIRSATLMFVGTALVLIFSDPMVDVLSAVGDKMGVQPFYVSFVLAPLASNASELLASYNYALKKTKASITISFSALLGAAIMNNTFCLAIFLALVFFKGLSWEFSAETISIVFVELCMFVVGRRIVHRVSHAMMVMALYPLSLVLVAVLENVVKLN